jgi:hypothetical protein
MTLPRFEAICKHWERVPPLAVSAAAIASRMGVVRQQAAAAKAERQDDQDRAASRQALVDMVGGAGGINREVPEWLRAAMT